MEETGKALTDKRVMLDLILQVRQGRHPIMGIGAGRGGVSLPVGRAPSVGRARGPHGRQRWRQAQSQQPKRQGENGSSCL